jgi:LmbE family N-acetylglucosaminyl deacetylase
MKIKLLCFIAITWFLSAPQTQLIAQQKDTALKVLIVIAHPDDESGFSGTIYKITHDLKGQADIALITNGEGGYKYSTLAEAYYGVELTDEKTGRKNLPTIRKQELMNAGKILGITKYFMLDQLDNKYTLNEKDPLDTTWDVEFVKRRLNQIMTKTHYDYVFTLLPVPGTHGGHKAATICALETIKNLKPEDRPIILGGSFAEKKDTSVLRFTELSGYPVTKIKAGAPMFTFDRTTKFGFKNMLDYKIIANWEIAEHKSQGAMQLGMNRGDYENFWYYDINDAGGIKKTTDLFNKLKIVNYKVKTY